MRPSPAKTAHLPRVQELKEVYTLTHKDRIEAFAQKKLQARIAKVAKRYISRLQLAAAKRKEERLEIEKRLKHEAGVADEARVADEANKTNESARTKKFVSFYTSSLPLTPAAKKTKRILMVLGGALVLGACYYTMKNQKSVLSHTDKLSESIKSISNRLGSSSLSMISTVKSKILNVVSSIKKAKLPSLRNIPLPHRAFEMLKKQTPAAVSSESTTRRHIHVVRPRIGRR